MKRIITLLTVVLLAMFLTACNNQAQAPAPTPTPEPAPAATPAPQEEVDEDEDEDEEQETADLSIEGTPFELYTIAMEKVAAEMAAADSFIMGSVIHMVMDMDGESLDVEMDMLISQVGSGVDVQMKIDMITNMMGMEMPMTIFFKDGVAYMDMMGMQMQMPMSLDELLAEFDISMDDFEPVDFELGDIISQEARAIPGGTELTFVLNPDAMNDAMEDAMEMLAMLGLDGEDVDIEFEDIMVIAILNDNNELEYTRMFSGFSMEADGELIFIEMDMAFEFIQFGGVTINFPDNLDDFIQF